MKHYFTRNFNDCDSDWVRTTGRLHWAAVLRVDNREMMTQAQHDPVSEQYCWAVILLSPIAILPPRPPRRDSCEVTWPPGSIRDHWAVSSWVLAATVLETTSALSPHHRHRKVHLGLAGQPGHGGHDRDSARTGQQGELLYTLYPCINIGSDKEQPIRRKNTLLTAVACVGVVSYVRMETYKCIKFNVTVTVKALVT